jgi:hypothetical protein
MLKGAARTAPPTRAAGTRRVREREVVVKQLGKKVDQKMA